MPHASEEVEVVDIARPRTRLRTRRWLLLAAVAAALVTWHGSRRSPSGPDSGMRLVSNAAANVARSEDRPLRICTFNIHSGKGRDGRTDLDRTASVLRNFDLVGLNEVRGRWPWQPADQAEQLGRALGVAWLFAPAERRWWHDDFGNGLLAALPVAHWQRIPLPATRDRSFRSALLASFRHRGRAIRLLVTHLARAEPADRQQQLAAVAALFLALQKPAVLLGDLNTPAGDRQLAELLATPGVCDPLAEKLRERVPPRIDWIITRGLATCDAGILDDGASDHPAYWAELDLPGDDDENR